MKKIIYIFSAVSLTISIASCDMSKKSTKNPSDNTEATRTDVATPTMDNKQVTEANIDSKYSLAYLGARDNGKVTDDTHILGYKIESTTRMNTKVADLLYKEINNPSNRIEATRKCKFEPFVAVLDASNNKAIALISNEDCHKIMLLNEDGSTSIKDLKLESNIVKILNTQQ